MSRTWRTLFDDPVWLTVLMVVIVTVGIMCAQVGYFGPWWAALLAPEWNGGR